MHPVGPQLRQNELQLMQIVPLSDQPLAVSQVEQVVIPKHLRHPGVQLIHFLIAESYMVPGVVQKQRDFKKMRPG